MSYLFENKKSEWVKTVKSQTWESGKERNKLIDKGGNDFTIVLSKTMQIKIPRKFYNDKSDLKSILNVFIKHYNIKSKNVDAWSPTARGLHKGASIGKKDEFYIRIYEEDYKKNKFGKEKSKDSQENQDKDKHIEEENTNSFKV